jgi:hypothetical protein
MNPRVAKRIGYCHAHTPLFERTANMAGFDLR